ncbi:hypothetical protein BLAT2472_80289 [Burkholderia latens]
MKEIRRSDAFHRGPNVVDVGEVSDCDVDATLPQGCRSIIIGAHIGAHALVHLEQFVNGETAGASGCTAYKNLRLVHHFAPFESESICSLKTKTRSICSHCRVFYSQPG